MSGTSPCVLQIGALPRVVMEPHLKPKRIASFVCCLSKCACGLLADEAVDDPSVFECAADRVAALDATCQGNETPRCCRLGGFNVCNGHHTSFGFAPLTLLRLRRPRSKSRTSSATVLLSVHHLSQCPIAATRKFRRHRIFSRRAPFVRHVRKLPSFPVHSELISLQQHHPSRLPLLHTLNPVSMQVEHLDAVMSLPT